MVRATPLFWRVHVFGEAASAEAVGENEVILRHRNGRIERFVYPSIDSVRSELEAFANAIPSPDRQSVPYPISLTDMVGTIALFEAVVSSIDSQQITKVRS